MTEHPIISEQFVRRIFRQSLILIFAAGVVGLGVNGLRPNRLPLVGDWSPEARMMVNGKKIAISPEDAKSLFESGKAVFLDARSPEDYRTGHISGARNLPWQQFDNYFVPTMSDIASDRIVIAYCDGESCHLSKELAKALTELGFLNVRVLINGWSVWLENNLPIRKGSER